MIKASIRSNIASYPKREVEVSFRFLKLDKFQAYSLAHEIQGASHQSNKETDCYVGYVSLNKESFEEINDYFIRQRIELADCDILVLVNTSSNTGIVEIPAIVNRMLKYIDCTLTFAYSTDDSI